MKKLKMLTLSAVMLLTACISSCMTTYNADGSKTVVPDAAFAKAMAEAGAAAFNTAVKAYVDTHQPASAAPATP